MRASSDINTVMSFSISGRARSAADKINVQPQLVLEIDGVNKYYGARIIAKRVRIGEDNLVIGNSWKIGGLVEIENQEDIISLNGTTTSIRQQLQPDKGVGSSISSMTVALIDKDLEATKLITPGLIVPDMLGRRCKVWLGFAEVAFPDDYIPIFRGVVSDIRVEPGQVLLDIAHPDTKKRQNLFPKTTHKLEFAITNSDTVVFIEGRPQIPMSENLQCFFKIDDEYMFAEPLDDSAGVFVVTRAQLGTVAASHEQGADIELLYRLKGNVIDLALWLMLSGGEDDGGFVGSYATVPYKSVNVINSDERVQDAFFFPGIDIAERIGVTVGDKIAQWDPTKPNFISTAPPSVYVKEIVKRHDGSLIIADLNGHPPLVDDLDGASLTFYSQFAILPVGLGMKPDEVDIEEHIRIKRMFLSNFDVEIFIEDDENIKDLIEKELYAAAGAYSLPRKSKASVGMHIGPIPGTQTQILNRHNIKDASKISVRRSINNNFYNTIVYKFDRVHDSDEYRSAVVVHDTDSTARIKVGVKALVIESRGVRSHLNGVNLATQAATRKLNRYKFAAEYIDQLKVLFKTGLTIEIGDIVLLDAGGLNVVNSAGGDRNPEPKFYEVINKSINLRTGEIVLSLIDTNYSTQSRYGLISPASKIKNGLSETEFIIEPSFNTDLYGQNEGKKWQRFVTREHTLMITVRSPDGARYAVAAVEAIQGNLVRLKSSLGFTPQSGDLMELAPYSHHSELIKSLYTFMSDTEFQDGKDQYRMI